MPENSVALDGKKIVRLRQLKGWNQEKLAQKSGYDPRTISNVENGKLVQLATLAAIAAALDVDPEELMITSSGGSSLPPEGGPEGGLYIALHTGTYDVQIRIDQPLSEFDLDKRNAVRDFITNFLNSPSVDPVRWMN